MISFKPKYCNWVALVFVVTPTRVFFFGLYLHAVMPFDLKQSEMHGGTPASWANVISRHFPMIMFCHLICRLTYSSLLYTVHYIRLRCLFVFYLRFLFSRFCWHHQYSDININSLAQPRDVFVIQETHHFLMSNSPTLLQDLACHVYYVYSW